MRTRTTAGLTLVELLVAMAILVIVLGIVGVYFARQASLTRTTQAHTQVQDSARSVMQIVTNDLLSAGASQFVSSASGVTTAAAVTGLLPLIGTDNGVADSFTVEYVSSLRTQATACRRVAYKVTNGTLERSDVGCSATSDSYAALADHVLAFNLSYVCSDSPTDIKAEPSGAAGCPSGTYVRSVRVGVALRSDDPAPGATSTATYTSPTNASDTASCTPGYACAILTQDVQTPNLKDN
ncbi:MAG TPA: prepilin-type N-terminal cleavage/methylation domain-containing protein [Trueperaceae bacterium]|nr:prepilin-type N-terminal cleavage/methylation domain-containing protein [Trueperaceae bacterium]